MWTKMDLILRFESLFTIPTFWTTISCIKKPKSFRWSFRMASDGCHWKVRVSVQIIWVCVCIYWWVTFSRTKCLFGVFRLKFSHSLSLRIVGASSNSQRWFVPMDKLKAYLQREKIKSILFVVWNTLCCRRLLLCISFFSLKYCLPFQFNTIVYYPFYICVLSICYWL